MKSILKALGLLFLLLFSIHILNNKIFSFPPIGKLLDPFHGYAVNSNKNNSKIHLSNLKSNVEVVWDNNNIPHIFAQNEHDLYMTQGYVVAQDRLWQMDFVTRLHEGRLSEIIGYNPNVLQTDRFMRTIGIVEGAKASLSAIANCKNKNGDIDDNWTGLEICPQGYQLQINEPEVYEMLINYSKGVNEYITSLHWDEYPIEYKILDYAPELWNPFKTCVLLKAMTLDLTGRNTDVIYQIIKDTYGDDIARDLYPESPYYKDPIIPVEDSKKNDYENLYDDTCNDESVELQSQKSQLVKLLIDLDYMHNPGIGSNNWAVEGQHTNNGNAILANDPHLRLSLPNVWYVMQLSTPDLDVMGATFPGAPGIISGFNNYIAWGETNGEDDVSDFYEITIDPQNSDNYIYDGESIPFDKREETIFIRGHAFKFPHDTTFIVKSTKHGPILIESNNDKLRYKTSVHPNVNLAFRWLAHDPTKEIKAFYNLNHATNYQEFKAALIDFECPCQNFVYADVSDTIAIYHKGKIPIRCRATGKGVLPGNNSKNLWTYDDSSKFIPIEDLPRVANPKRGYVSSANQHPIENYPYYLPGIYWPAHRASRINDLLEEMKNDPKKIDIEDMKIIQNDSYNKFAELILPNLLLSIELKIKKQSDKGLKDIFNALSNWDRYHKEDAFEPLIFEQWYENLNNEIWKDLFINEPSLQDLNNSKLYPLYDVLGDLIVNINDSESDWTKHKIIPNKEEFYSIIWSTFKKSINNLEDNENLKNKHFSEWKYSDVRSANIHHIVSSSDFDVFSAMNIPTSGSRWSPNAINGKFGPSWRYIVELKKDSVHAIAIYPGGQSGNPGSKHYDDYIEKWKNGEYINLNFTYYQNKNNLKGQRTLFKK